MRKERPPSTPAGLGAGLTPEELAAWRGFLRAHARLVRELDAELVAAHGLPLAWYDVLVVLEEAGGGSAWPSSRGRCS